MQRVITDEIEKSAPSSGEDLRPDQTETPSRAVGRSRQNRRSLRHEQWVLMMALLSGLPGTALALLLLWSSNYSSRLQWTLTAAILVGWLGFAYSLRNRVIFPLQTLSNILAGLREGDFSLRARIARRDDALGELLSEANSLGETLRAQRLGAMEATTLLRKVMAEIDVAIFTFDVEQRLRLVNRAGERLLAQPSERLLGRDAGDLGLANCLEGDPTRTLQISFPGGTGRWGVRRSTFHEQGLPHQLLVISDLSLALREEERQAWQRLVRVLGHELNNSLAPIMSIAGSLENLLSRVTRQSSELPAGDWSDDMARGLAVITTRAEALNRFMSAYARLAKLPRPQLRPLKVAAWVQRVVGLETRLPIKTEPGSDVTISADGDQLDQLLINLVRNAVDAALETGGGVTVGWKSNRTTLEVWVIDGGPGLSNTTNLFVPFFTTKPAGSGIGLVLSRQIAEAHGGTLTLENRRPGPGCEARLRLPL